MARTRATRRTRWRTSSGVAVSAATLGGLRGAGPGKRLEPARAGGRRRGPRGHGRCAGRSGSV
eukprot:2641062-Lingulodinium_polyedra.AAC.1